MSASIHAKTAIVLVGPYNDFLHAEGKLHRAIGESLTATDTVAHLKQLANTARENHIPIYYALHQTWNEGNYAGWKQMNSSTKALQQTRAFEEGSWGAKIHEGLEPDVLGNGDVVVNKHWNSR
jgi:nicotinamidase-related amidase